DPLAVGRKYRADDSASVSLKRLADRCARCDVPQPHRPVLRRGNCSLSVRRKRGPIDDVRMSLEGTDVLSGGGIPKQQVFVPGGGHYKLAVRRNPATDNRSSMSL